MPEMLEIEEYRLAADPVIGRTISAVHAPDEWYAKGATTPDALRAELPGLRITGTRRIGKLMLVDTDGPVLGLPELRDELAAQGIQLKDGKDPETGERVTTWEFKR